MNEVPVLSHSVIPKAWNLDVQIAQDGLCRRDCAIKVRGIVGYLGQQQPGLQAFGLGPEAGLAIKDIEIIG